MKWLLASFVADVGNAGASWWQGTSFSKSLKGPFPDEMERLSAPFAHLPGFELG